MNKMPSMLNTEQQEAVDTLTGPMLVLAGAGSGKTRVVTTRIVNLIENGVHPSEILGLTFTNKAAAEMKERITHLTNCSVLICTFHSLGARILRESGDLLGYRKDFTIYDEQDVEKLMKVCLEDLAIKSKIDAKGFLQAISHAKNAMVAPETIGDTHFAKLDQQVSAVYSHYQKKLKEFNAVDFDDLLFLPVMLFKAHPQALEYYRNRWQQLLIDEFQDTNCAQYTLVKLLVEKHQNICVVGDPDQSIYSWRGADVGNILGFEQDFPAVKVIRLEQNYRSRTNILNAANELIQNNDSRYEKRLWSERGPGDKIKHYTADTEKQEAEFVSEKIRDHYEHHDIPLKQMAVFYRTNAQSRALEDRLIQRRIPYVIVGGVSFYQRREVKDILAFVKLVVTDSDYISFSRTINIPKRGLGEATLEKIRVSASLEGRSLLSFCQELCNETPVQHPVRLSAKQKQGLQAYVAIINDLKAVYKSCSIKDLVAKAIERSGYLDYLAAEPDSMQERKENLNALVAKANEWELSADQPTLEGFFEEISLKSSLDEAEGGEDRVSLMTIHNGKGLEFEVVFLVGLEEDLFPHANARDSALAQEEERRLCYVGMTRAKEFLYLCDVRQRFLWGTHRMQRPSRFLYEISSQYVERIRPHYHVAPMFRKVQEEEVEEPFSDELGEERGELADEEGFGIGDAVFHTTFGIGVVKERYIGSSGLTYKVFFSKDSRERSLVASLANLRKL